MSLLTHTPKAGSARSNRWVPFALIALVAFPAVAGTLRLVELAGGPGILPANPRMSASPLPVFVHVLTAVVYAVLGAFQFSSRLRRDHPALHRAAGKVVLTCGLALALSGIWMTLVYARQPGTGELAWLFRLIFGSAMTAAMVLGYRAIRRRDVPNHRAWMMRGYAIAVAAGTQTVTLTVGPALFGASVLIKDLSLGAAWLLNLAVAEAVIRRQAKSTVPVRLIAAGSR